MRLFTLLAVLLCVGCQGNTTPPPISQPTSAAVSFVELQAMRDELQSQLRVTTSHYEAGRRSPDWETEKSRWEPTIERLQSQLTKANAAVNESLKVHYGD